MLLGFISSPLTNLIPYSTLQWFVHIVTWLLPVPELCSQDCPTALAQQVCAQEKIPHMGFACTCTKHEVWCRTLGCEPSPHAKAKCQGFGMFPQGWDASAPRPLGWLWLQHLLSILSAKGSCKAGLVQSSPPCCGCTDRLHSSGGGHFTLVFCFLKPKRKRDEVKCPAVYPIQLLPGLHDETRTLGTCAGHWEDGRVCCHCGLREEEQPGMCFPPPTLADLLLVCFSGGEKHIPSGGSDRARNRRKKSKGLALVQCFEKRCWIYMN